MRQLNRCKVLISRTSWGLIQLLACGAKRSMWLWDHNTTRSAIGFVHWPLSYMSVCMQTVCFYIPVNWISFLNIHQMLVLVHCSSAKFAQKYFNIMSGYPYSKPMWDVTLRTPRTYIIWLLRQRKSNKICNSKLHVQKKIYALYKKNIDNISNIVFFSELPTTIREQFWTQIIVSPHWFKYLCMLCILCSNKVPQSYHYIATTL